MHCAVQNSINFGSQAWALLNEHAVEHALVSIMLPHDILHSAPVFLLHEKDAEIEQDDSQSSTHA